LFVFCHADLRDICGTFFARRPMALAVSRCTSSQVWPYAAPTKAAGIPTYSPTFHSERPRCSSQLQHVCRKTCGVIRCGSPARRARPANLQAVSNASFTSSTGPPLCSIRKRAESLRQRRMCAHSRSDIGTLGAFFFVSRSATPLRCRMPRSRSIHPLLRLSTLQAQDAGLARPAAVAGDDEARELVVDLVVVAHTVLVPTYRAPEQRRSLRAREPTDALLRRLRFGHRDLVLELAMSMREVQRGLQRQEIVARHRRATTPRHVVAAPFRRDRRHRVVCPELAEIFDG